MNEKESGAQNQRAASGFSWGVYFHGAGLSAAAVACLVGVLIASAPTLPTDDFGSAGMGFVFAAVVVVPWFVFSLLVGGPVVLLVNATAIRPPWVRIWAGALAAALLALVALFLLWPPATFWQAIVLWGVIPVLSGGCWAFAIARRVLPRRGMGSPTAISDGHSHPSR